ncbi:MAG: hypothetical protein QN122_12035 [Armatimonadota bacterium]|nr:hypothetical protein [Armatimonadota bacterium]
MAKALEAYAVTGIVAAACRAAGIHRDTWYYWRDRDERFRLAVAAAREDAADSLEQVALRRATTGEVLRRVTTRTYVDGQGREVTETTVTEERHISDRLLLALLAAHRPERWGRRAVELRGTGEGGAIALEQRAPQRTPERLRELLGAMLELGLDLGVYAVREEE